MSRERENESGAVSAARGGAMNGQATAKDYQDLRAAYGDVCRERDGLRKRLEKAVAALEVAAAQLYTLAEIADGKEIGPL